MVIFSCLNTLYPSNTSKKGWKIEWKRGAVIKKVHNGRHLDAITVLPQVLHQSSDYTDVFIL